MEINKRIKKIILQIILIYFGLVAVLYLLQRTMIFFPDKTAPTVTAHHALGNGVNNFSVVTEDGLNITGLLHQADEGKPTIVFFHGNAGHYGHRIYNAADYMQAGFGVVLAGYRGYGGNEGSPSEAGFYKDARAYISQLINDGVDEKDIILYGQSIGSGVAVQMATEFKNVRALVLEAPYTSLPDVAKKRYFFIPVKLLMKDQFDSLSKIQDVKAPLLIMQGLNDRVISPTLGQKLYEAANEPKEIFQLEGYGHNDLPFDRLASKVIDFVED